MSEQPVVAKPKTRPLRTVDFRPRELPNIAADPLVLRIGHKLAASVASAFAEFGPATPRVTVDGIVEDNSLSADGHGTWIRLETRAGSMNFYVVLDRSSIFAMCELALGGAGTEVTFDESERPLSGIETGLCEGFIACLAEKVVEVMSSQLDTPVSQFSETAGTPDQSSSPSTSLICFKALINVFDYSGEIKFFVDRDELTTQLSASNSSAGDELQLKHGREEFGRRVADATSVFQVSFPSETMQIRDVASLSPGRFLRLSSSMNSTVTVSCGGNAIYTGVLVPAKDHLVVKLLAALQ